MAYQIATINGSRVTGSPSLYYAVKKEEQTSSSSEIYNISYLKFEGSENRMGVRPVVYLKTTVQTDGKDSNGAWRIVDK